MLLTLVTANVSRGFMKLNQSFFFLKSWLCYDAFQNVGGKCDKNVDCEEDFWQVLEGDVDRCGKKTNQPRRGAWPGLLASPSSPHFCDLNELSFMRCCGGVCDHSLLHATSPLIEATHVGRRAPSLAKILCSAPALMCPTSGTLTHKNSIDTLLIYLSFPPQ